LDDEQDFLLKSKYPLKFMKSRNYPVDQSGKLTTMSKFQQLFSRKKTHPSDDKQKQITSREKIYQSIIDFVSKKYGWVLLITGTLIVLEQMREHGVLGLDSNYRPIIFYAEVFFVVLILGSMGLLVRGLLITLAEKSRAINMLKLKHTFIQQLSKSEGIPDLTKSLVRQITSIAPSVELELFIHEPNKDWFIRAKHPDENGMAHHSDQLPGAIDRYPCQDCILNKNSKLNSLITCKHEDISLNLNTMAGFCLPLVYGMAPVGLLLLYSPDDKKLTDEQIETLENLSSEMSNAIGMVLELKAREEARMSEKIHSLQMDIARDLHDTVGQNIGFLRMKLDHLTEKNAGIQSDLIMEIRSMSKVANESYDLVRGTLAVLQADSSVDLLYMLSRYAEQIAERSEFIIEFSSSGVPMILSSSRLRHLFYIFREALSNIEKHANASNVQIEMRWDVSNLTLNISDNGRGYDLSKTQKVDIHYGLKFMKERAQILNGSLHVTSVLGKGTTISVCIPCE
jgi:signal transduction histidine kinase